MFDALFVMSKKIPLVGDVSRCRSRRRVLFLRPWSLGSAANKPSTATGSCRRTAATAARPFFVVTAAEG